MSVICPSLIANQLPSLCRAVDLYCERTSAATFDEPLNTLSNVGFLIAGWAAWRLARKRWAGSSPVALATGEGDRRRRWRGQPQASRSVVAPSTMLRMVPLPRFAGEDQGAQRLITALIALVFLIGIGSFLFHALGAAWAALFDVIPIFVFMLLMLWLALTRFFGWPAWAAVLASIGFVAAGGVVSALPIPLPAGGAGYLPALFTLIAVSFALARQRSKAAPAFLTASGVFLVSFAARTIDLPACAAFPTGTHFVWHILNALVLYLLVRGAITAQNLSSNRSR